MGGRRSKATGKRGESSAKKFLIELGFTVAMTEVQGLAGDDLFARDPEGKWWSVEVKNVASPLPKFVNQARTQAEERYNAIQDIMSHGSDVEKGYYSFLGIDNFRKSDWLILWHPNGWRVRDGNWFVAYDDGGYTGITTIHKREGWKQWLSKTPMVR